MRESLKFIVSLVHNNMPNISKADLINHANDYHLYQPIVNMGQLAPMMAQMTGNVNEIVSLNEITLSAEEFCAIVREVYGEENAQQNEVNEIGIFERYIQNLREANPNDQVNEADVNATREDVEQTYNRIREVAASGVNNADRAYGLVVGHVQSGKTRNYIGLALKAYEDGYNVVIVLTSNNTALAAQTKNRLMQEFGNAGCVPHNLDFLNNDFNVNIAVGHYYFGIAQKEIHHLEGIQNWLNAHQNQVESIRLFVIDDESDNATPNTNENQNADDLSDADVMRIADDILAGGNRVVSDWVRSLVKIDFDENDDVVTNARTLVTNNNGKSAIINLITNEEEVVCRLLGLDQDVDIEGQMLRLSEQVAGVFNNIARASNPVRNWKTLRNLAWYCFNVRPNRSRINHTIVSLFSRANQTSEYRYKFDRLAYVGYTATPYANVLNENPEMDPLASDFMYPMHKSSHYFGMARIFGEPTCQNDCNTNMNIVRKIDSEQELIDLIRELYDEQVDGKQIRVNENLEVIYQESPDLIACVQYDWASLKEAIAWLFCVAASRRLRRMQLNDTEQQRKIANRWTTMLFNIGSEKGLHCYQKNIIQNYLNALANNDQVREEFVQLCQTRWENERGLFTREKFEAACPDYRSEIDDYSDWGAINEEIQWFLNRVANDNRVHAVEINCSPEGNAGLNKFKNTEDQYSNNNEDHIWIVCGGNKISRGLTLEGLVVTYFDRIRTSTCVDTLLQMGRWFGYREGYELLPRLWMNSDTIKEFKKMAKVERLMHKDLKDAFDAYPEYTPKDRGHYARIMQYGRNLSGRTAAAICSLASSGTGDVINAVSSARRQDVLSVLNDFINQLGVNHQLNRPQTIYCSQDNANDTGFHSYPYWRNVSAEQIRGLLTRISQYAPTGEATSKINALNGEVVTCPWDVVISNQVPKGNPTYYEIANGLSVRLANNEITSVQGDVVKFGKFVGDRHAFFSGVKTKYIVQAEVSMIRKMLQDPTWRPLNNVTREECQTAIEQAAEDCMLDAQIRRAAGLARMSGKNYRDVVFSQIPQAECTNPIFQISLVQPSDNNGLQVEGTLPFVVLSFYWPNRIDSERYWWASAGFNENDGETPQIDNHTIAVCIDEIIDYHLFLHKDVLRVLLEERLGNVSNEKFNAALEMSRCCNINEGQGWLGLRTEIVYDGRWMQGWLKDVRNCYGIENIDECYAVRLQLESEAALILEYNDGRMHQTVLNNSLLDCGRRRDSIVRNNDFALLFENMEFRNELRQIHFGNDYIEQNEFNNY